MFQLVVYLKSEYDGLVTYIKRKEDDAVTFDSIDAYNEEKLGSWRRRQDRGYRCRLMEEEAGSRMSIKIFHLIQ